MQTIVHVILVSSFGQKYSSIVSNEQQAAHSRIDAFYAATFNSKWPSTPSS